MGKHRGKKYVVSNQNRSIRLISVALAIFFLLTVPVTAIPDPDDLVIEGTFGFNGYYKRETPTPINITIRNDGEQFDGWISADLSSWVPPTYYTNRVAIPPGTSRPIELSCFGAYNATTRNITVTLLTSDGNPIKQEVLDISIIGSSDSLVVHLGNPSGDLDNLFEGPNPGAIVMVSEGSNQLPGIYSYQPKIFPVTASPTDLPHNPILLDGISLITANISTWLSLPDPIRDTIFEYVRHGGNILIYYRDGIDPVDGWETDPILHVSPADGTVSITYDEFVGACSAVFPQKEYWGDKPTFGYEIERNISGEFIEDTEVESLNGHPSIEKLQFTQPDSYKLIQVEPDVPSVVIDSHISGTILLSTRLLGSGHAAFAAFDPFEGSPTARDLPVRLLALSGLLNPISPVRELASDSVVTIQNLQELPIQEFFRRGSLSSGGQVMRWFEALGPALIYLLGLPILIIVAKGRGQIILGLFIIWSVLFTGYTLVQRTIPLSEKIMINEVSLYWCEALIPDEIDYADTGPTILYTGMSYRATTSVPRNIEFNYENGVLDEFVDPTTWPYGRLTIEEGDNIRLPDLPLETIAFQTSSPGERKFLYRRPAPELTATGQLTVGPDFAHLYFDADLPFPTESSRVTVSSNEMFVGKNFGPQGEEFHLDMDLIENGEIRRSEDLFPNWEWEGPGSFDSGNTVSHEQDIPHHLRRVQDIIFSMPVRRAQFNLVEDETERPLQAQMMLTSFGVASDVNIDRGELEHHSMTVMVISIPIVYVEEPRGE
ncbi:hypothetical protein KAU08_02490 [bacterium]|nr:hypothetical protein [bacterium]